MPVYTNIIINVIEFLCQFFCWSWIQLITYSYFYHYLLQSLLLILIYFFKSLLHIFIHLFAHLLLSMCSYWCPAFWFCTAFFPIIWAMIFIMYWHNFQNVPLIKESPWFWCQWSEEHTFRDAYIFPYNANYNFMRIILGSTKLSFPLHQELYLRCIVSF